MRDNGAGRALNSCIEQKVDCQEDGRKEELVETDALKGAYGSPQWLRPHTHEQVLVDHACLQNSVPYARRRPLWDRCAVRTTVYNDTEAVKGLMQGPLPVVPLPPPSLNPLLCECVPHERKHAWNLCAPHPVYLPKVSDQRWGAGSSHCAARLASRHTPGQGPRNKHRSASPRHTG